MEKPEIKARPTSLLVLVVANLIPVAGVVFWQWSVFEIVCLYWFENVVIGAINILKMARCSPRPELLAAMAAKSEGTNLAGALDSTADGTLHHVVKIFLIPFFAFHYGMFCLVHGMFVAVVLGNEGGGLMARGPFSGLATTIGGMFGSGGGWFVLAIIGSHLFSYVFNFLGKGEFREISVPELMAAPYGRIVVLHIAILFGAFAVVALGHSVFLLLLLIIGKIILDAKLHLRSHRKLQTVGARP